MSERELIEGLTRLADPVVPGADPYGRLMARHRRARRTRVAGWSTATVVAVVAALLGPIAIQGAAIPMFGGPSGAPSAPAETTPGQPLTPWVTELLQAPTYGSLSGDADFLRQLRELLADRTSDTVPGGQIAILFAGDVGEHRFVIAVRHSSTHFVTLELADRAGASIEQLGAEGTGEVQRNRIAVTTDGTRPFLAAAVESWTSTGKRRTVAGVAPPSCLIEVADAYRRPVAWKPAPAGHVTSTDLDEWVRITCAGVIRYQGPADANGGRIVMAPLSEADVDAALAGARGEVDRERAKQYLQRGDAARPSGPSRLLYMHRIGTGPQAEAAYYVTATPMRDGAWNVTIGADEVGATGFTTGADLGAADTVLALEIGWLERAEQGGERVYVGGPEAAVPVPFLVLAPRTATTVQVLDDRGRVLQTAPLTDGVGRVYLTKPSRLRALGASGAVLGTGQAPPPPLPPGSNAVPALEHISNWP
ncbi:hypothetical protein [Catellatospora sp. NPDC049609]|uniref:hypothetical protein n=1 Tax=Catellatospora sp. NPDC049609 TaxID=3155505 RepID=UPI00342E27FB